MLYQRLIRENPALIASGLKNRGIGIDLNQLQLETKGLKEIEEQRNNLQAQGNLIGKEVGDDPVAITLFFDL